MRNCASCNTARNDHQPCSGSCKLVYYCNTDCRRADQPRHRKECKTPKRIGSGQGPARDQTINSDTAQGLNSRHEGNHNPQLGLPPPDLHPPHSPPSTGHHATEPTSNRIPDTHLTNPFHALHYRTWLHDRDLETAALLLHDTFRHRRHLCTIYKSETDQVRLRKDPTIALKNWILEAIGKQLLSPSQMKSSMVYVDQLINKAQAWARTVEEHGGHSGIPTAPDNNNTNDNMLLPTVWDDASINKRHKDEKMGLQMRIFGEQVMGWAVNKPNDESRKMVLADKEVSDDLLKWEKWREQGDPPGFDWRAIFGHLTGEEN